MRPWTYITPVSVEFVSVTISQSTYYFISLTYLTLLFSIIILVWIWWCLFVGLGLVVAIAVLMVVGGWMVDLVVGGGGGWRDGPWMEALKQEGMVGWTDRWMDRFTVVIFAVKHSHHQSH